MSKNASATRSPATAQPPLQLPEESTFLAQTGKGRQALTASDFPELVSLGLAPTGHLPVPRNDGTLPPHLSYQPVGTLGVKTLLKLSKLRQATSENFMGTEGFAVRHGIKVAYQFLNEQEEVCSGEQWILWNGSDNFQVVKSPSACMAIDKIVSLLGGFPFTEALRLKIIKCKSKSGFYYFDVEIVD